MTKFHLPLAIVLGMIMLGCSENEQSQGSSSGDPMFTLLDPVTTNVKFSNDIVETPDFHYFLWDHIYTGSGVGIGDFNNDGLSDIFLTATTNEDALFINKGNLTFEDITQSAGVAGGKTISSGIAVADVNNDGWQDIYVCKSGPTLNPNERRNLLYINNGDLTFSEQAGARGLNDPGYTINAAFFDYDKDGDLDVYVMNQPPSTRYEKRDLTLDREHLYYEEFNASDRLYRNDGRGGFIDVSAEAGIDNFAYGLGIVTSDLNNDGWPDVYISNDYNKSDQIYINQQDGTFKDMAAEMLRHSAWFSMGMDINDFNNDGHPDIVAVDMPGKNHYRSKTNMGSMSPETYYQTLEYGQIPQFMFNVLQLNNGDGTFSDIAHFAGLSKTDWSWSTIFGDYDNDGFKDIFITNGIKRDIRNNDFIEAGKDLVAEAGDASKVNPLEMVELAPSNPISNFMFHNKGNLKFEDLTEAWGLGEPGFSHGMAQADLDNDGDLDMIVNNIDANVSIYRNNNSSNNHWVRLKLNSGGDNTPVIGAKAYLYSGEDMQFQELLTTRGFESCSENAIHYGLGQNTSVDKIVVVWPNGMTTSLLNPAIDQVHELSMSDASSEPFSPEQSAPLFVDATAELGIEFTHEEFTFDDYSKQVLLPYRYSQLGPALAVGDVNGDDLDDIFVGASSGHAPALFVQTADGFELTDQHGLGQTRITENTGAKLFDVDGDGDKDLYVASGSYQHDYSAPGNMDQIYINDGTGKMQRTGFAGISTPTRSIAYADYDNDGDLDMFVGGRVVPGAYPAGPPSYLFENRDGFMVDVSGRLVYADQTNAMGMESGTMGMVTGSVFSDYDGDGDLDLITVGEWTPIMIFENRGLGFVQLENNRALNELTGLWQSITVGDFNGDGREDFLCGNMGTNNKFKASKEQPFKVMGQDFDQNGKYDVVLVTYYDDKEVPTRGRECSSEQLPFIAEKFPTFEEFATASIDDIFEPDLRRDALELSVNTMYSGILYNLGNGEFEFKKLDNALQLSPIMGAVVRDFNNDGNLDIAGAGNLYETEIETLRYDAGTGFIMLGDGNGGFEVKRGISAGLSANLDAKSVEFCRLADGSSLMLVANNNGPLQAFKFVGNEVQ